MRPGCLVRALKNESFPCPGFDCQGIEEIIWQHCLFGSQEGWRGVNTFLPHQFKEKKKNRTWRLRRLEPLSGTSPDWMSSTMTTTPNWYHERTSRLFGVWREQRGKEILWRVAYYGGRPSNFKYPNIKNRLKCERIKIFAFNKRLIWRGWNSSSCRQRSVHFNGCFIFFLGEFLPKKHKFWDSSKMNRDIGLKLSRSVITFDSSQKMFWDEISPTNRSRDDGF